MASVGNQLVFPVFNSRATEAQFGTHTLNETTDYVATEFTVPESQTITQLGVNIATATGSPVLEISLQGVSNGIPDGTIKSSGNAKTSWTATSGWTWQTLTSSYAATAGELLCWVVKLTGGTSAVINCRISGTPGFPVNITFDNTLGTTTRTSAMPVWGAKGSGTSWCWGAPISTTGQTSITNASTVESGMLLTMPSWFTSAQVIGVRSVNRWQTTGTSVEFGIYSGGAAGDTTRAQTVTLTGNDVQATASQLPVFVYFPAPVTINGGASFRISGRVTAGTWIELNHSVAATEDMLAWTSFWGNSNAQRTRRTSGNWTDSNTNLVFIEPIIGDITVPSGGGGSVALPLVRSF